MFESFEGIPIHNIIWYFFNVLWLFPANIISAWKFFNQPFYTASVLKGDLKEEKLNLRIKPFLLINDKWDNVFRIYV
jgi:hypothetical protein